MQPIKIFDLLSQNSRWLTTRQSVVAQNIANSNTPGFKALDVRPFDEILDQVYLDLKTSDPRHMSLGSDHLMQIESEANSSDDVLYSGNNVSIEKEFAVSGEISRGYTLNVGLTKSFNRMLMMSTKG